MHLEMQRRMIVQLAALAVVLTAAGCASRAPSSNGAPVAALMPAPPPEAGPTYRLQVGDDIKVRFLYQPEQNEDIPVRPDGRISLGTTGEITVVGLTPTELERLIVERSSTRLRDPEVTVVVTKIGEQRVYVGVRSGTRATSRCAPR